MFHADLRRHANLFRAGAEQFSQARRRHRAGNAHFTLTADFRPGNGGIHLVQRADRPAGHKVADINFRADGFDKVVVIGEYRRNDAAGAVGRRGHHATAGGVLFIDRQCEHIDPVNDIHWIAGELIAGHQQTTQRRGATRHAQRTRQHAFGVHPAVDTGAHGLPDVGEIVLDLFFAVQRQLVLHHHPGERQAGLFTIRQHFLRRFKRVGHLQFVGVFFAEVLFIDDKAAANRVIGLAVDLFLAGPGMNGHAVFVQRQVVAAKTHAVIRREVDLVLAVGQQQSAARLDVTDKCRDRVNIDRIGLIARQSHDNGDVRMVAFAG